MQGRHPSHGYKEVEVVKLAWHSGKDTYYWKPTLPLEDGYPSLRDEVWGGTFGELQAILVMHRQQAHITLAFSELGWSDPLPLLALATSLRGFIEATGSTLTIELGDSPNGHRKRGAFLRFIAEHRFLRLFHSDRPGQSVCFIWDGTTYSGKEQFEQLEKALEVFTYRLTYHDSLCLRACVYAVPDVINEEDKKKLVSDYLQEIRNYGLRPMFEKRPYLVDVILYKLRVVLSELVDNAFEHAFDDKEEGVPSRYFGVYARIRKRAPDSVAETDWQTARVREKTHCPTLGNFAITPQNDWIDLFYYDPGRGLLADLSIWAKLAAKKERGSNLARLLGRTVKATTNRLHRLSKLIFADPISRYPRDGRTVLTGLQHIGLALANDYDFARLAVDREWAGAPHPWKHITQSGLVNLGKRNTYRDLPHTKGTAWHFCLAIRTGDVKLSNDWVAVDQQARQMLSDGMVGAAMTAEQCADWEIVDERDLGNESTAADGTVAQPAQSMLLWLPGDVTKQHVYGWVHSICGALRKLPNNRVATWVIADVPSYQAGTLAEIIRSERVHPDKRIEIYIVCDDWRCTCLRAERYGVLKFNSQRAREFISTNVAFLFRILRYNDSKIFWKGIPVKPPPTSTDDIPFVYEPVEWEGTDGPKATLSGYLDLSQALTEPLRAAVCQRALSRAWRLFAPGTRCIAADALLAGLLPEEAVQMEHVEPGKQEPRQTNVSSVLVTGSTAKRNRRRSNGVTLHLFRHTHVAFVGEAPNVKGEPVALDWLPAPPVMAERPSDKLPYQRIPGTPFIGRGGAKAIPVRRFDRPTKNPDGTYMVFINSFYGESPQATYEHFSLLGILKLGHWRYEGHHDLFTVNLGKAYTLERNDRGPLVEWLTRTLRELREDACMLVYPSHFVTDSIIRDLRKKHWDCLPPHVIPVHFLGMYSQSSIRIPSLTYDRIRRIAKKETDSGRTPHVILFDDGTITGKVAREIEQLIRNAGAKKVYTVILVTRAGLPLYRRLIIDTQDLRKNYWRWDVPALGNRRTCPLCKALDQARILFLNMPDGENKLRIKKWIDVWECREVGLDWESHGLSPQQLPQSRDMTFGKEWFVDGELKKYKVKHTTTTGLAAMVVELMRITTYKAVGLQIADKPAGRPGVERPEDRPIWDRARFEILIGQLLLFFDDFDADELNERFSRLFQLLLEREASTEIDALACLTLLLAEPENAEPVIDASRDRLMQQEISSQDGLLALGFLLNRIGSDWSSFIPKELEADQDKKDKIRVLRKNFAYAWYAYAGREKDPDLKQRAALRMIVLLLGDTRKTMHHAFLRDRTISPKDANLYALHSDLERLRNALGDIRAELYISDPSLRFDPNRLKDEIAAWLRKITELNSTDANNKSELIDRLHQWLFGEGGLAQHFQAEFLCSLGALAEFIRSDASDEVWSRFIDNKIQEKPVIKQRWQVPGKRGFRRPDVYVEPPDNTIEPMILCPPLVRKVISDLVMNVVHSCGPLRQNDREGNVDMECKLSIHKDHALVTLVNLASADVDPIPKLNQINMESLRKKPVVYSSKERDDGTYELTVEIRIPTVASLGRTTNE